MIATINSPVVQPYLHFDGCTEEAIEYYKRALGAEVKMLLRFKESPEPPPAMPPGSENKIMHAQLSIGQSIVMMSDGRCGGKATFQGFTLTIMAATEAEASKYFGALADGGTVQMPLTKTFFSPSFGMVADRFGVSWMVLVQAQPQK